MTFGELESAVRKLGPFPVKIPTRIDVSMSFYSMLMTESFTSTIYEGASQSTVSIRIDHDQDIPWIMYDQNGEEMDRSK